MKSKFDKINETLNLESTSIVKEVETSKSKNIQKIEGNIPLDCSNEDFEYTRGNLYSLIEKGQEAIDDIMELAHQSESPRAYEVAGQLIKNVGDVADKLIDLQQKMKKLKEEDIKGPKNVTNALFVGSTADLQKLLKQDFIDNK